MNTGRLRDYAERMYYKDFKPNKREDEWYSYKGYTINIFIWDAEFTFGDTNRIACNIYEGPDSDSLHLIDDFVILD